VVIILGHADGAQAGVSGAAYQHPYDVGMCGNLHTICGDNALLWFVPSRAAAEGDGLSFVTSWDLGA
jgi:palmitoyltransferase